MKARLRKKYPEADQGFTLIELLVVMIIIGLLAAIAIPLFLNQRRRAVDASMKQDIRTVAMHLEGLYGEDRNYPASYAATTTPSGVTLSKGNQVALTTPATAGQPGTYCLVISRVAGAGPASQSAWVYASNQSGVQPKGVTACP